MLAIHSMQLQKEVKSNPKQPSCKKKVCGPKKAIVKKDLKSKVVAKKWFDGRLIAKILIKTIQVNLVPNPEGNTNLSELSLLPLACHQSMFWLPPWISHLFSLWPSWELHTLFYN